jgi:ketosteroid isomerase-like protein
MFRFKRFVFPFLFVLTLPSSVSLAQNATDDYHSHVNMLANAELAFSKMAGDKNTRAAFMFFMSDSVVTFGEYPRVGKDHLLSQEPNETLLSWYPVYADVSASHDFGYTFGPWEFRSTRNDQAPAATGHFISVWRKENDTWKVALDIGIEHPYKQFSVEEKQLSSPKHTHSHVKHPGSVETIITMEKQFIHEFSTNATSAYKKHITGHTKFFRSGLLPFTFEKIRQDNVAYSLIDGQISPSGDMAFVYGTAQWSREETPAENQQASYMRIWKKEGGTWKIVADVLTAR